MSYYFVNKYCVGYLETFLTVSKSHLHPPPESQIDSLNLSCYSALFHGSFPSVDLQTPAYTTCLYFNNLLSSYRITPHQLCSCGCESSNSALRATRKSPRPTHRRGLRVKCSLALSWIYLPSHHHSDGSCSMKFGCRFLLSSLAIHTSFGWHNAPPKSIFVLDINFIPHPAPSIHPENSPILSHTWQAL